MRKLEKSKLFGTVGDDRVVRKLHGMVGAALGLRSKVSCITEHRGQWNQTGDALYTKTRLNTSDLSASCTQVAKHVADMFVGARDRDGHDGLENRRRSYLAGSPESC